MWSSLYCGVKEIRRWWWCYCCFYFLECWLVALRHTCTQWRPPPAGAKRRQRRTRRCVPFRKGCWLAASPPVGESAQMAGHTRKLALCLSAAHTAIERFTAQLPWLPLSIRTLIVGCNALMFVVFRSVFEQCLWIFSSRSFCSQGIESMFLQIFWCSGFYCIFGRIFCVIICVHF